MEGELLTALPDGVPVWATPYDLAQEAREHEVSQATIHAVVNGRSWR